MISTGRHCYPLLENNQSATVRMDHRFCKACVLTNKNDYPLSMQSRFFRHISPFSLTAVKYIKYSVMYFLNQIRILVGPLNFLLWSSKEKHLVCSSSPSSCTTKNNNFGHLFALMWSVPKILVPYFLLIVRLLVRSIRGLLS